MKYTARKGVKWAMLAAVALGSAVALTACAGTGSSGGNASALVVQVNNAGPQPQNFNPLLASSPVQAVNQNWAMLYEPLIQYNVVKPGQTYPWLATSWKWSDGGKTITMNLRNGVKWSDGQAFTSADVVFTLNLIKKFPALNLNGISFASASAPDKSTVVINFDAPAYTQLYFVGGQLPIVPEHIWSKIPNPTTYDDPNPVGTGPYVLDRYTPQEVDLKKNPLYWSNVPISELKFPIISSTSTSTSELLSGQVQWTTGGEPDFKRLYVDKSKYNHYWYPEVQPISLVANLTKSPLDNVAVRKAISYALDRKAIDVSGEFGYEAPITSATGLVSTQLSYLDPKYKDDKLTFDLAKSKALLTSAGFHWDASGQLIGANGSPVQLSIEDPSGFEDYISDCQIIAKELQKIGIAVTVKGVSTNTWNADLASGNFDLSVDWSAIGPSPYNGYNYLLNSDQSAAIGSNAASDFERWKDPATQKFLNDYASSGNAQQQQAALSGLEGIMVDQMPVIPLVGGADWGTYTDRTFVGWPTPSNPYADDSPVGPNGEYVVLHLSQRKSG
jgi:peptide/nickel transport system substrate-binding protein